MFSPLTYLYWAITTIAKVWLLFCLRNSRYKWFRNYLTFSLGKSLGLWACALSVSQLTYFYTYYLGGLAEHFLVLFALVELGKPLLCPLDTVPYVLRRNATISVIFVVLTLGVCVLTSTQSPIFRYAAFRRIDAAFSALSLVLLLGVAALAKSLRIPWRQHAQWIAYGFTFYLTLETAYSFRILPLNRPELLWVHANAFLITTVIWTIGLCSAETPRMAPSLDVLNAALIEAALLTNSPPKKPARAVRPQLRVKGRAL